MQKLLRGPQIHQLRVRQVQDDLGLHSLPVERELRVKNVIGHIIGIIRMTYIMLSMYNGVLNTL